MTELTPQDKQRIEQEAEKFVPSARTGMPGKIGTIPIDEIERGS